MELGDPAHIAEVRLPSVTELRVDAGEVHGHRVSSLAYRASLIGRIGYVLAPHMRIGVPKETAAGEHRVALVPEVVSKLRAKGLDVVVQSGAGADALLSDEAFAEAGAKVTDDAAEVWGSDVVVTIAPPDPEQIRALGKGSILIGFLAPLTSPATTRALAEAGATAVAMEAIPRISRAQAMDALSSRSE